MDRCPRLQILSVLFWKRRKHMLKHRRIRSQPSGTSRSTLGPAWPQVQPAPPPLVQRSRDTSSSPATPPKAKNTGGRGFPSLPDYFLPPQPPPLDDPELPPPLDFVLPTPAVAKRPPMPHPRKRHEASMFRSSK
ncbi:amyloid beta A4 precursor protein-binding family B member 1-interacting protein-like [Pan troglodytes]|uniref:amyloid beta A4 precursor protein-binding family B member 1-interacting protein-like n=1 Tax=Pan troglodytes TaxID=9598 RepID=UPI0030135509